MIDLGWVYFPFVMVILIGTSNATNLTDGLDGLLTGLLIFAFGAFMVIAYISGRADFSSYLNIPHIQGSSELVIPAMAIIGACIGFYGTTHTLPRSLWVMWDHLPLVQLWASSRLSLKRDLTDYYWWGLCDGSALGDDSSWLLSLHQKRYGTGRRILRMAPLHHHFEITWKEARSDQSKPWSETKVVIRFWILGILFTLFALATLKLQ